MQKRINNENDFSLSSRKQEFSNLLKSKRIEFQFVEFQCMELADHINIILNDYDRPLLVFEREKIKPWVKKHNMESILEAIEISKDKYLPDIPKFIDKVGGILFMKNLSRIDQTIHILSKEITSTFYSCNSCSAKQVLALYVDYLQSIGWNDQQIIDDLNNDVKPLILESNSFEEFITIIDGWIARS